MKKEQLYYTSYVQRKGETIIVVKTELITDTYILMNPFKTERNRNYTSSTSIPPDTDKYHTVYRNPQSYTSGRVATGRVSLAGQVKG
jgi:hypothetical protein